MDALAILAILILAGAIIVLLHYYLQHNADLMNKVRNYVPYSVQNRDEEEKVPSGKFMGELYAIYSHIGRFCWSNAYLDAMGYISASMYATCVNAEYGGTVQHYLGIDNVRLFCSDVSATASSW